MGVEAVAAGCVVAAEALPKSPPVGADVVVSGCLAAPNRPPLLGAAADVLEPAFPNRPPPPTEVVAG